jgi:hypothetical protein
MLSAAYHKEGALLVVSLHGRPEPDDYERLIEAGMVLDRDGLQLGKRTAEILLIEDGYPRPDATQRRRFTDTAQLLKVQKPLFALVTTSALIRGVLTAMTWVAPVRHTMGVFATFEEAARFMEAERGQLLPTLRRLYEQLWVAAARRRAT